MKIITSTLFTDMLDNERQKVFYRLEKFKNTFILAGGTAIMLQIGYRKSFDFDLFTLRKMPNNLARKVRSVFPMVKVIVNTGEVINFFTGNKIELNFVQYPYRPIKKPIKTESISLFHLDDLVADKAYTIGRRGQWRDYVDIFIFLQHNFYSLNKVIDLAEEKFQGEFNAKLFLDQLVYFDDINIIPTNFIKQDHSAAEIKSYLSDQVKKYTKTIIK